MITLRQTMATMMKSVGIGLVISAIVDFLTISTMLWKSKETTD